MIGGGVSGLTTAVALLESGWDTRIVARNSFESTVSVVAAAVWTTTSAEPVESTRRWATTSWHRFDAIAGVASSGVARLRQVELERIDPGPGWWDTTRFVTRLDADELPPGYEAGWEIDGFIIEPPRYLRWLTDRVTELGGAITRADVSALDEVDGDLVVNCTGLGAARLTGDGSLYPIRGQVVAVANPGLDAAISDESDADHIAYVYPRTDEVILGGVRQSHVDDPSPDPETTDRILRDCRGLEPAIADQAVVDVRVGFRPGRPTVRVELGSLDDGRPVVHNYGHAGAGFILSWGCAAEVVDLVSAATTSAS